MVSLKSLVAAVMSVNYTASSYSPEDVVTANIRCGTTVDEFRLFEINAQNKTLRESVIDVSDLPEALVSRAIAQRNQAFGEVSAWMKEGFTWAGIQKNTADLWVQTA